MLPDAPATFSMITGWPSEDRIPSARTRAIVSEEPPAAYGTINVTGRDGYACPAALPANPEPIARLNTTAEIRCRGMAQFLVGIDAVRLQR
jgi:hypothetical protein